MNGVHNPADRHAYRVRFPDPSDPAVDVEVRATVDRTTRTVTVDLPDRTRTTLDAVTARAVSMLLSDAVYGSLDSVGPRLRVERADVPSRPPAAEATGEPR